MKPTVLLMASALVATACAPTLPYAEPRPRDTPPPADARLRSELVFYDYRQTAPYAGAEIVVSFRDARREWTLPPGEIRLREMGSPSSATYATASTGEITIRAHLARGGQRLTEDLVVTVPAQLDWIWGFAFHVKSGNPVEGCFGCMGYRSTPIAGAPEGLQFHVTWGGNSISAPAVY